MLHGFHEPRRNIRIVDAVPRAQPQQPTVKPFVIAEAFAVLPQQEQSILILHCVMELNDVEIGRLMGMSKSAVQRHRTKTLKELRVKLMAIMPEGG